MPFGYAETSINRVGLKASLYRVTPAYDSVRGTMKRGSSSYTLITDFFYAPVVVDKQIRQVTGGWIDKVDMTIHVPPTLDINTITSSRASLGETDIVEIDGERYTVGHVTSYTLFRHTYKIVGLKHNTDHVLE